MTTTTRLRPMLVLSGAALAGLVGCSSHDAVPAGPAPQPPSTSVVAAASPSTGAVAAPSASVGVTVTATAVASVSPVPAPATSAGQRPASPAPSASSSEKSRVKGVSESTMGAGTLTLRYVDVTLAVPAKAPSENIQAFDVKVCVKQLPPGFEKGLPVSPRVWSHHSFPPKTAWARTTKGATPLLPTTVLQAGQCAKGFVNFDITGARGKRFDGATVVYETSFGDRAMWSFD